MKGAVLISMVFNIQRFIKHLEKSLFGLYNSNMAKGLVKILKENKKVFGPLSKEYNFDFDKEVEKINGIRDFDKLITVRTQPFKDPDDYYNHGYYAGNAFILMLYSHMQKFEHPWSNYMFC